MTARPDRIGVGIVGLSARRGFAADAHLPALATVPELELRALATSGPASAAQAAEAFGVDGHGDHRELAGRDDIDVVVVSVKVPHHREVVLAALEAGKHVLCEWPLGRTLAETEELATAAAAAGVHGFVGLQARSAPAVRHVRRLVAGGAVGEVLSTTVVGAAGKWGATTDEFSRYLLDEANGASMLTIPFGHTAEAVGWALGEFRDVTATCATRRMSALDVSSGEQVPVSVADQIATTGTLGAGAVYSLHYRGGMTAGTGLLWEVNGSEADLVVRSATDGLLAGNLQFGQVTVEIGTAKTGLTLLETPADLHTTELPASIMAQAVAGTYRLIADILLGRAVAADGIATFDDALVRHRMLDAVTRSAKDGRRIDLRAAAQS